jgi:hypothetical protein
MRLDDHQDRHVVNVHDLLGMFFEMRLTQHTEPAFRRQVARFQERTRGVLEADALSALPRSPRDVLWATFRGPELAWRLRAHGYQAIGWLLEENVGAPS